VHMHVAHTMGNFGSPDKMPYAYIEMMHYEC
jgi:hypothetical protein